MGDPAHGDPAKVVIFDTTLRDGEQAPGFSMDVPAKLTMARALDALAVDIIEAGFPIASLADFQAVQQIAQELRRPVIAALARSRPQDIEEAARALEPAERSRIHTFLATSDLHLTTKLRMTREACLEAAVEGVRLARRFTDDVEFSAEDATRSDSDFLCRVVEAVIEAGATTVNLPDTVGYGTPDETRDFFSRLIERVPNAGRAIFSAHCHDDLGLAVANSLAAIQGGARLLTQLTREPVQANKAIVGRNAFAHEAGIHQDGVLKDPRTYEIMRPQDVGQPTARLVLGRHSGRHAVQSRCEALGFHLTSAELDHVYRAVIDFSDNRRAIGDGDLRRIIDRLNVSATTHPANGHPETLGYGHGV